MSTGGSFYSMREEALRTAVVQKCALKGTLIRKEAYRNSN